MRDRERESAGERNKIKRPIISFVTTRVRGACTEESKGYCLAAKPVSWDSIRGEGQVGRTPKTSCSLTEIC